MIRICHPNIKQVRIIHIRRDAEKLVNGIVTLRLYNCDSLQSTRPKSFWRKLKREVIFLLF